MLWNLHVTGTTVSHHCSPVTGPPLIGESALAMLLDWYKSAVTSDGLTWRRGWTGCPAPRALWMWQSSVGVPVLICHTLPCDWLCCWLICQCGTVIWTCYLCGLAVRCPPQEREKRDRSLLSWSDHTSDVEIGSLVATLPGPWRFRVCARTGWSSVIRLWLTEIMSSESVWQQVQLL